MARLTYHGNPFSRLWMTRIVRTNDTGKGFDALPVRIYAGEGTVRLAGQGDIAGSIHKVEFAPAYVHELAIASDAAPTKEQQAIFSSRRDFLIPVVNRGD